MSGTVTYLNCFSKVFAFAFFRNNWLINLACCDVMVTRQSWIYKTFIVPEVKISLAAVVEHEHLAVLKGRHSSGIDIDVWVDFYVCNSPAPCFEQHANAAGGDTLAQAAFQTYIIGYGVFRPIVECECLVLSLIARRWFKKKPFLEAEEDVKAYLLWRRRTSFNS